MPFLSCAFQLFGPVCFGVDGKITDAFWISFKVEQVESATRLWGKQQIGARTRR
jgi:hypothetical protein